MKSKTYRQKHWATQGFTLVEMAMVLVIMGLLLGGGLTVLSTQMEQQKVKGTERQLEEVKEALIGFALANGRLPCPASATSSGQESFASGGSAADGRCSNFYDGFLPAVALGITPVDAQGYATDAWGIAQNRIRYAVYTGTINSTLNPFTRTNGIKTAGLANFAASLLLRVCASAAGITATTCGTATVLTNNAPAVIYSVGKNAASGGTGTDEFANPNPNSANNDAVFVSHTPAALGATNGEFDDMVTWLSPNILFSRMVQAVQLP